MTTFGALPQQQCTKLGYGMYLIDHARRSVRPNEHDHSRVGKAYGSSRSDFICFLSTQRIACALTFMPCQIGNALCRVSTLLDERTRRLAILARHRLTFRIMGRKCLCLPKTHKTFFALRPPLFGTLRKIYHTDYSTASASFVCLRLFAQWGL